MSAQTKRRQGHPFIALLRESLPSRENTSDWHRQRAGNRERGIGTGYLTLKSALLRIDHETIERILAGEYIPTMEQIGQLAEDCGLQRGDALGRNAEFMRLGGEYHDVYSPKKKLKTEAIAGERETQPATPAPPPTTLPEALRLIRKSRYYYPFDQHRDQPVLTAEEYHALKPAQKKMAKPLSAFHLRMLGEGLGGAAYSQIESGAYAPLTLDRLFALLRCSPDEKELLKSVHSSRLTPEQDSNIFTEWRMRSRLSIAQLATKYNIQPRTISHIETGRAPPRDLTNALKKIGFDSIDEMASAIAEMPETNKMSRRWQGTEGDPVRTEDAHAFKNWALRSGLTLNEIAEKTGISMASVSSLIIANASQRLFNHACASLGFSDGAAMEAAAALMPETLASMRGHLEPGVRPGSSGRRGR